MKHFDFDALILAAKPADYIGNRAFTDKVMAEVQHPEIFSAAIRNINVTKKETFIMKLRHLPKVAIVAIAIATVALLTGTTYAIVKTVQEVSNVKVSTTSTNEFGRKQLQVTFEQCALTNNDDTTYELKEGSGLSAEDGIKALQANCEMTLISDWIRKDVLSDNNAPVFLLDQADTITAINDTTITLKKMGERPLPQTAKTFLRTTAIERSELKVGDTVIYPDFTSSIYAPYTVSDQVMVFQVTQPVAYYEMSIQSYVNPRGPCLNNPDRTCLKSNHINQATLLVTYGGGQPSIGQTRTIKYVQGRVVSYDASKITLDVGKGVIYTVQTPMNIIDRYNQGTVYGLAAYDTSYAKTDPEALKITAGDSLNIAYMEDEAAASHDLNWSDVTAVTLMVERIPNNLDVLKKY